MLTIKRIMQMLFASLLVAGVVASWPASAENKGGGTNGVQKVSPKQTTSHSLSDAGKAGFKKGANTGTGDFDKKIIHDTSQGVIQNYK